MNEELLAALGTSSAALEEANGAAIAPAFELLESGVYPATIKEVFIYTEPTYKNTHIKVVFNLTDSDRDVTYRSDLASKLKPASEGAVPADNIGYANRIKQICFAAGVELDQLSMGAPTKIKIYGKDADAKPLQGLVGKSVLACVRKSNNTAKEEGESYKYSNDVDGVCAVNGLDATGENAKEVFEAKVTKTPIFNIKGKATKTGGTTADATVTDAQKSAMTNMLNV